MTATAPLCPMASLATPISSGKTVPPKSPIIISPETSFFLSGTAVSACAKMMGNTLEFPNPMSAIHIYIM